MIGIVVSGHGHFASGIVSALQLLAGVPDALQVVDFEGEDSVQMLEEKIKASVDGVKGEEGVLILTDLQGGSPFNVAMRLAAQEKGLEVVTGTNLPMLVEAYMSRSMFESASELAVSIVCSGKEQVKGLEKTVGSEDADEDEIELD